MVLNFLSIVFYRAVSFIKLCRPYLSLVYFNTLYFCRQNFQWFLTEKMKIFSLNPFSEFQIEKVRSFDFSLILNVFISYSSCLSYWRSYAINFLCYSSCGQKILLDQSLLKEEEIMGVVTTWVGVPLYRFTFVIDDPKKVHRLLLWKRLLQSLPKRVTFSSEMIPKLPNKVQRTPNKVTRFFSWLIVRFKFVSPLQNTQLFPKNIAFSCPTHSFLVIPTVNIGLRTFLIA